MAFYSKISISILLLILIVAVPVMRAAQTSDAPSENWDARFRALVDSVQIRELARRLSARPHHPGSAAGKENVEWMAARFRDWGWDARIERFEVLFPTPRERRLELVAPRRVVARLQEEPESLEPPEAQIGDRLPGYNAYSADGDVTGPLVYVNYGRPEDYDVLDRLGVSVKGAIVIARHGASWRGIKPKVAAERGAIGCLIYSDPRDDGYFEGDVVPLGPMRNRDGVQRGSVLDMPLYPGDPLTPGVGATGNVKRLAKRDAPTIMTIPVLPISYGDAQPFLEELGGPVAPQDWRGGLPLTYHIGPGPAVVRLTLAFDWRTVPVYNVLARIPGALYPDEWIVRGNHHDAWVYGAYDPVSGLAPELEEARVLGELRKRGWSPKRTIVYAAWDGEEPALLGSTEWVEDHRHELEKHAVAYLNTDTNARGFLTVGGSHSLEAFANDTARAVDDPDTTLSVWQRQQKRAIAQGSAKERQEARTRGHLRIDALGSGSDYTPFLQHAGVASLHFGFGDADPDGSYHSVHDSFEHYTKFHDTDFAYGRALARTVGTAVIRLADADLLPFDFIGLADTVARYVTSLQLTLRQQQDDVRETNRQIDEGVPAAVDNKRAPRLPPTKRDVPPALNFAPLENAVSRLAAVATRYRVEVDVTAPHLDVDAVRRLNATLIQSERQLTDSKGLPRRPWYRHLLYAPGLYTGYGVKTMPGVREAIEQNRFAEAETEILRAARAIERLALRLDAAVTDLATHRR